MGLAAESSSGPAAAAYASKCASESVRVQQGPTLPLVAPISMVEAAESASRPAAAANASECAAESVRVQLGPTLPAVGPVV